MVFLSGCCSNDSFVEVHPSPALEVGLVGAAESGARQAEGVHDQEEAADQLEGHRRLPETDDLNQISPE